MTRVLCTLQKTKTASIELLKLVGPNADIRCSNPPFNNRHLPEWDAVSENVDTPVYGTDIPKQINRLLQHRTFVAHCQSTGVKLPVWGVSTFCQSKIGAVFDLAEALDKRGHDTARLRRFAHDVAALDPDDIKNVDDWSKFLEYHGVSDDWESKLHFDQVGHLFGVYDSAIPSKSYRWLSKIVALWSLQGCLADVVNTICIVLGRHHDLGGVEVGQLIRTFAENLRPDGDHTGWWIPDVLAEDEEGDDVFTRGILTYLNPQLRVLIQLPPGPKFDPIEKRLVRPKGCTVFRDPDSRNGKAILYFAE